MTDGTAGEVLWRALAEKAIGGSLDSLASTTADGVAIEPLYRRRSDERARPWRCGEWSVSARVDHTDPDAANKLALLDLEGGADALTLVFAENRFARGYGLATDGLDASLASIELDFISMRLDAGRDTLAASRALATLIAARRLGSAGLRVDLGYDPIGLHAVTGTAVGSEDLPALMRLAREAGLSGRVLLADGRPYHEAGAGEALELACVLASGVAYLRRLEDAGFSLDAARDTIAFLLAMDANVFPGLAKVRALRRLWARVEAASDLTPKPIRVHAETSWRMMTRHDPWTNVMRATAATFAAGVGGADALTVLPFTLPLGLPDAAARRLARNVQRVLIDEAHLALVDDPAAGSGGLEALTDGLCERAWALFQAIEAEGSIEASLGAGQVQARIAAAARDRVSVIANRRAGIVGTSLFASLGAPLPPWLDVPPRPEAQAAHGALPSIRDAEPYESLRDRAATARRRPTIFLARLGAPAAYGARATYAANFFAAGGLAAVTTNEEEDLAPAFRASGALVACLCGADKTYADLAAGSAKALRDAGALLVFQAGASAAETADIDAAIYDGCDALGLLDEALGIALHD